MPERKRKLPGKPVTTAAVTGKRVAQVRRATKETSIAVDLTLDGKADSSAKTGIPFFDHMLEQLGKHAGWSFRVRATGDLEVDAHHTVEDCGIAVGEALQAALGDKVGIARFGAALVPLDEALIQVALDLSARPFMVYEVDAKTKLIGSYDSRLTEEFLRAFVQSSGATLHVRMLSGKNPHHIAEATFKALAIAIRDACRVIGGGVPSTKGKL